MYLCIRGSDVGGREKGVLFNGPGTPGATTEPSKPIDRCEGTVE